MSYGNTHEMIFYCDGGCRNNGGDGATAAAAAVLKLPSGSTLVWSQRLNVNNPTNQMAELQAIAMALRAALDRHNLTPRSYVDVKIYTDSRYAVDCMNHWIHTWYNNGWQTAWGGQVRNQQLIMQIDELRQTLRGYGAVNIAWIPRAQNSEADAAVRNVLGSR